MKTDVTEKSPGQAIGDQWKMLTTLSADLKALQSELQCLHGAYVTQLDVLTDTLETAAGEASFVSHAHLLIQVGEVNFLSIPLVKDLIQKTLLEHEYVYLSLSEDIRRLAHKDETATPAHNLAQAPFKPITTH